jgi:hypothetical protein
LLGAPSGLRLTNPTNPVTHSLNTFSIQGSLTERIDYVMPCGLLFSNLIASQVFRTDLLNPVPLNLNSNDDQVASDHLPVMLVFANPHDPPFRVLSISASNQLVTLQWETSAGRQYRVDSSSNLTTWSALAGNLVATNAMLSYRTNFSEAQRFFRVYRVP